MQDDRRLKDKAMDHFDHEPGRRVVCQGEQA